jgi:hypothetical protein
LNVKDITKAFSADEKPGSMKGTVSGLISRVNIIEVYPSKKWK